jgi:hypothetical protein
MARVEFKSRIDNGEVIVDEIHEIVAHVFSLEGGTDIEVYMAEPIWNWQQSEAGKFIMENSVEQPAVKTQADFGTYSVKCAILAKLEKKKLVEYYLKFDKTVKI